MNQQDHNDELKQAYHQTKQRYPAPGRIKRAIMQDQPGNAGWSVFTRLKTMMPGREWLALSAAAGCMLLMFNVFTPALFNQPTDKIIALQIEYHGYQDEIINLPDYREKLTLYTREYTRQLSTLNSFYSRPAMLARHDENWSFTDCRNQTITVSHELIEDLKALQRVDPALAEGTFVALAFDEQGRLVKIEQTSIKSC